MNKEYHLTAICDGQLIPLRQVGDPIFAQRLTGDGAAIIPKSSCFVAPCDGKVRLIFKGGHALVLESEDGMEVMIHIGLGTVNLNGIGFTIHVKKGQEVKKGDLLVEVDLDLMKEKNVDLTSVLLLMKPRSLRDIHVKERGTAKENQTILITYEHY